MNPMFTLQAQRTSWPESWNAGALILDRLNRDDLAPDLSAAQLHECLPAGIGDNAQWMPVVMDLASVGPEIRQALLAHARRSAIERTPPFVCAHLRSAASARDLASHLATCMTGTDHASGFALWRFHDPRVFIHMTWCLRPAQLHALIGPCERWEFPWAGDWYALDRPVSTPCPTSDPRPWWPDAAQWRTVCNVADIERVLAALAKDGKPAVADAANVDRLVSVAADVLHLSSDADRQLFALHGAVLGDAFENHEKLLAVWPTIARGGMTLGEGLAVLTRDDWSLLHIMANTLRQTGSTHHG